VGLKQDIIIIDIIERIYSNREITNSKLTVKREEIYISIIV